MYRIKWSNKVLIGVVSLILGLIGGSESIVEAHSPLNENDKKDPGVIQFHKIEASQSISSSWDEHPDPQISGTSSFTQSLNTDSSKTEENQSIASASTEENPGNFKLKQNYPNPFNPATEISYTLPVNRNVILKVYDMLGRPIKTLVNKRQEAGTYTVQFNASGLTSGMYLYRLKAGDYEQIRKMILIK